MLDRIHFTGTPQLSLVVDGDARDIHSFAVRLNVNAPSMQTPWGGARDIQLTANLTAPAGTPTNFDSVVGVVDQRCSRIGWPGRRIRRN